MFYQQTIEGRENQLSPTFRGFLEIARAEKPLTADSLLRAWAECDMVRHKMLAEMRAISDPAVPRVRDAGVSAWRAGVDQLKGKQFVTWTQCVTRSGSIFSPRLQRWCQ